MGIEMAGNVIVAVSGGVGVPKFWSSRLRLLQTTKRRLIIIVRPTPPSIQSTAVLVEEDPFRVPVVASEALFDDEDDEDALALFSASLPRKLLPASLLRMLLCGEVASCSIVALDSEATCEVDGAAVGGKVVWAVVLAGAAVVGIAEAASVATGVDTGVILVAGSVATGVVAASVASGAGGIVVASVASGVAMVATGAVGAGESVTSAVAVTSGFAAVTTPASCARTPTSGDENIASVIAAAKISRRRTSRAMSTTSSCSQWGELQRKTLNEVAEQNGLCTRRPVTHPIASTARVSREKSFELPHNAAGHQRKPAVRGTKPHTTR